MRPVLRARKSRRAKPSGLLCVPLEPWPSGNPSFPRCGQHLLGNRQHQVIIEQLRTSGRSRTADFDRQICPSTSRTSHFAG